MQKSKGIAEHTGHVERWLVVEVIGISTPTSFKLQLDDKGYYKRNISDRVSRTDIGDALLREDLQYRCWSFTSLSVLAIASTAPGRVALATIDAHHMRDITPSSKR